MTRGLSSLTARLVGLALAQLAMLVAMATVIAWLTLPDPGPVAGAGAAPGRGADLGPHHSHGPRGRHRGPPRARREPPPQRHLGPLLTLVASGLVLGVGGYLTARWLVLPLRHLSRTARAVGDGDLDARAGLNRADEIGEVARAFDEMVERLGQQMAAERELLANIAHELRTPMARIRVATDLAAEGDAHAARLALEDITTDLAELEQIVDDVLMTTRLDAARRARRDGLRPDRVEEVSVLRLAQDARARFALRHPNRVLELEGDDVTVEADEALLRRALDNLLQNAVKYSSRERPICVVVRRCGDRVRVDVKDEGVGLSEADAARAFEPFFRAERSRDRGAGGVGLGLTLVRTIVESHGGTVAIASELDVGTTVTIELPASL